MAGASPPSRRRGLKCFAADIMRKGGFVASFAEAWIEISMARFMYPLIVSPPSRRRGLKFAALLDPALCAKVASFAEAWIEIPVGVTFASASQVASHAEAWIETVLF